MLENGDHYVLQKLHNELLPWMIAGRWVKRQWFVGVSSVNSYLGDILAALAGLGIGSPLVQLLSGKIPEGKSALDVLHDSLPGPWFWIGVGALIAWVILRVVIKQENVVARALLAADCAQSMQKLYAQLFAALPDSNPMPRIAEI